MKIVKCTKDNIDQLALWNKQLIEDEKSNNPMNLEQLKERMSGFLETDYTAYFFQSDNEMVGYALVRVTGEPLYLRQFFICRDQRRHHYGQEAFQMLLDYLKTDCIELEVLPWNETGMKFWEKCGFHEISRYLKFQKKE